MADVAVVFFDGFANHCFFDAFKVEIVEMNLIAFWYCGCVERKVRGLKDAVFFAIGVEEYIGK